MDSLAARVKRLRRELRESARGVPQRDVEYDNIVELITADIGTETQRKAMRELHRPIYRILTQHYHPDRETGDREMYDNVVKAYKHGNFPYLKEVYYTRFLAKNLHWQCTEGVAYTKKLAETADQRFELLRNTPAFQVLVAHRRGDAETALDLTSTILIQQAVSLEMEVAHTRATNRAAAR